MKTLKLCPDASRYGCNMKYHNSYDAQAAVLGALLHYKTQGSTAMETVFCEHTVNEHITHRSLRPPCVNTAL